MLPLAERKFRSDTPIVDIKCYCATMHYTKFCYFTQYHTSLCTCFCIYRKVYDYLIHYF